MCKLASKIESITNLIIISIDDEASNVKISFFWIKHFVKNVKVFNMFKHFFNSKIKFLIIFWYPAPGFKIGIIKHYWLQHPGTNGAKTLVLMCCHVLKKVKNLNNFRK